MPPTDDGQGPGPMPAMFPQRLRTAARHARQLSPAEQDALITKLEAGSSQDQAIAGLAAVATQNKAWVAKHIVDTTPGLQHLALRYSYLLADDAIEDALAGDLSDFTRKAIICHGLNGRDQLADKLFPSMRKTWGDRIAVRVLVHCSPSTVELHLPKLLPFASAALLWTKFAAKHAGILLTVLEKSLDDAAAMGFPPTSWWDQMGVAVVALLKRNCSYAPRVLDMVDKHELSAFPYKLHDQLSAFARLAPARVLGYLCKPDWLPRLSHHAMRRIARPAAGTPALIKYAETFIGKTSACDVLLKALPPRDRLPVYEAAKVNGVKHLQLLPHQEQIRIAKEVLEKYKRGSASRLDELTAVSFLGPSEAAPWLEEFMMSPDMDLRRHALQCYAKNAARSRSPAAWDAALDKLAVRLRNQPQRVRESIIDVLCEVPPMTWTTGSLASMYKIAKDALEAPDIMKAAPLLSSFALNTMRDRPTFETWSLGLLKLINKVRSARLSERVRHGQFIEVFKALAPDLEAGMAEKQYGWVFSVANWAGKRLKDIPQLQDMLYSIVDRADFPNDVRLACHMVRMALQLLINVDRSYAVKAIEHDRSALDFDCVADVIARYHPELLHLDTPPKGRWLKDTGHWTIPCKPSLSKYWTEDQVAIYLEQLKRDVEKGDRYDLASRVRKLKHVSGGIPIAKQYTLNSDVCIAEAALSVLANDPKELPTLLSYASTDSARVAMYCAAHAAKHVPTTALQPLLVDVLAGEKTKITSQKEVLRIIARLLPVESSTRILSETAIAPKAHRDVVTAAAIAALDYLLCDPSGWAIVEAAAQQSKGTCLAVAKRSPLLINDRARYAKLVTSLANTSDDEVALAVLGNLGNWASLDPSAWTTLRSAVTDTGRCKAWKAAAQSLMVRASDIKGQETLCAALSDLLAMEDRPDDDAGEDLDLPVFRRVCDIAHSLISLTKDSPSKYGPAARAALRTMEASGNKDYEEEYCDLLLSLWKVDQGVLPVVIARLDGRPVMAQHCAEDMSVWLQPGEALAIAPKLAKGCYTAALFAVSLASTMGPQCNWEQEWKDVVKTLRSHDSAEIRSFARHIKAMQHDIML